MKDRPWFLLLYALMAGLAFLVVDCASGPTVKERGIVVGREYRPAYYTYEARTHTTYDSKGNASGSYTTTEPVYHSEEYELFVQSAAGVQSVSTSKAEYYVTSENTVIEYCVYYGRWTDWRYYNSY